MPRLAYNVKTALLVAGLWLVSPSPIHAQTIVVDDDLTFGRIVMRDNSAPKDIQLHPAGNYTADPAYIFFDEEPTLGRVTVTGQTPNALMDVTIDLVTPVGIGGCCPAGFTLINPFTVPAVVVTNPAGTTTFQVGGTLRSDGSGTPFLDATYSGTFSISVAPN